MIDDEETRTERLLTILMMIFAPLAIPFLLLAFGIMQSLVEDIKGGDPATKRAVKRLAGLEQCPYGHWGTEPFPGGLFCRACYCYYKKLPDGRFRVVLADPLIISRLRREVR